MWKDKVKEKQLHINQSIEIEETDNIDKQIE